MTTTQNQSPVHVQTDPVGLPYARAGVTDAGLCTTTCPACGDVFEARTAKAASAKYAEHFTAQAKAEVA